ncbi:unnamed protein product [Leptosia nina]|uniref:C1q domain-containing protein n=1 Tax=Leptosia nina TaxID=320188 RepID=A0AAV1JJ00_9NEOP
MVTGGSQNCHAEDILCGNRKLVGSQGQARPPPATGLVGGARGVRARETVLTCDSRPPRQFRDYPPPRSTFHVPLARHVAFDPRRRSLP